MTRQKIKRILLLVWTDIVKNNYFDKRDTKYFKYVENMSHNCPLWEYFEDDCKYCILNCREENSDWKRWVHNEDIQGAKNILQKIKNWKV